MVVTVNTSEYWLSRWKQLECDVTDRQFMGGVMRVALSVHRCLLRIGETSDMKAQ